MTAAEAFGDMLRRQRERRDLPLKTIAEQTKIGPAFLTALERGDCSKWPGGIYSRAWIRAYAAAVGLDPDEIGAQFNRCFARNAFPDGDVVVSPAMPADLPRITPMRLTLSPDPREQRRAVTKRVLFFGLDLLVSAFIAALTALLTPAGFWMAYTGAILACHGVGLFGGAGSATGFIDRSLRQHALRRSDDAAASPVAEAA